MLFIEPSEIAYIPFTKKRGVPLVEYEVKGDEHIRALSLQYLSQIRERCARDREFYEESVTAFVADIRVVVQWLLHRRRIATTTATSFFASTIWI